MNAPQTVFPQVCAFENLYRAFRHARRGKRGREEVAGFEYDLEGNIIRLQGELERGEYWPGDPTGTSGFASLNAERSARRPSATGSSTTPSAR